MSDLQSHAGAFCSVCGVELNTDQSTVADTEFAADAQGVYDNERGHVVIEGAHVRVLVHEEGSA